MKHTSIAGGSEALRDFSIISVRAASEGAAPEVAWTIRERTEGALGGGAWCLTQILVSIVITSINQCPTLAQAPVSVEGANSTAGPRPESLQ